LSFQDTTGATSGAETTEPSETSEFTPGFLKVQVAQSFVFCVVFCGSLFVLLCHCIVCPSIYGFLLCHCIVCPSFDLRFLIVSLYSISFDIRFLIVSLYSMSFDLRFLIVSLYSMSFDLRLLIITLVSSNFSHIVNCLLNSAYLNLTLNRTKLKQNILYILFFISINCKVYTD
jgi:hypothetical protein